MVRIKLFFKSVIYQSFLLTVVFESMGRLGQIGSSQTCKILTLGTEIEKPAAGLFKVSIIKAEYVKECFWRTFPTKDNGVTH